MKKNIILIAAGLLLAATFVQSCSKDTLVSPNSTVTSTTNHDDPTDPSTPQPPPPPPK